MVMKPGAPTTPNEQAQNFNSNQVAQPHAEQTHIRYGKVSGVSKNSLVQVVLLNDNGEPEGKEIVQGTFLPVNTPMSSILLQWGPLRKGLICRVFWKGNSEPDATCSIDIIGDEEHRFLIKEPYPSDIAIGPWKIFAGGMTV